VGGLAGELAEVVGAAKALFNIYTIYDFFFFFLSLYAYTIYDT